jgi:hypothetical protein
VDKLTEIKTTLKTLEGDGAPMIEQPAINYIFADHTP